MTASDARAHDPAMGARTGEQFLQGLRKTSSMVWLGDECVENVTAHPALAQAAHTLGSVFETVDGILAAGRERA